VYDGTRWRDVTVDEREWLADWFEANRPLGSVSEADDAVQESLLRLRRSGTSGVEHLGG
jgi:RNA polymerase sigma-70 factor, ECF subfamily